MKMQTNNLVGDAVRVMRTRRNMTQEQLSEKSGIGRVVISRIETGKEIPKVDTFLVLCAATNHELLLQDNEEVFIEDDIDEF